MIRDQIKTKSKHTPANQGPGEGFEVGLTHSYGGGTLNAQR